MEHNERVASMRINITVEHMDLVGTTPQDFCGTMYMIQNLAKANKLQSNLVSSVEPLENYLNQKTVSKTEKAETKPNNVGKEEPPITGEKSTIDRAAIETEIKRIPQNAANPKEMAEKIRDLIIGMGYQRMSDIPDDNITELLKKVKDL